MCFKQISINFSKFLSVVKGETFLSGCCQTWQFDALLLQVTNPRSHSKHKHKTPGVCFCPISSEVVSLEQMLRGSAVSVCLLPPHFSFSLLVYKSSEEWILGCSRLKELLAHTHPHTHTLPPFTVPLINYQIATRIAFLFLSTSPLISFGAPLARGGRLIIAGFMVGQNKGRRLGWLIFLGNPLALWRPHPSWRYWYLLLMIHLVLLY